MNTETKEPFNPTLDEATAVAASVILNNHIEAMKAWERKLRVPYMPSSRMFSVVPTYGKPTLASLLHMKVDIKRCELEMARLMLAFTEAAVKERNKMGSTGV